MKKHAKKLLAFAMAFAMCLGIIGSAAATTAKKTAILNYKDINVTLNGKDIALKDVNGKAVEPFTIDGTTYVPVRAVAEALGLNVDWVSDKTEVKLSSRTDTFTLPAKVDKSTQPRVLITTDVEVDDMNGIMLTLMFASDFDLAGIVWTAGQHHFSGDGVHTLAEITPNYRCEATTVDGTVKNAGQLKEFRPADPDFLTRIIDVDYRADYQYLSKHNPNYPTPDHLLSITKVGNIEFEGDYRFETDGSKLIYDCIMDNDPRPLYIQHWGGINTTVRALYSIYEEYHNEDGTPKAGWDDILKKVTDKVRICGDGEDNCRPDSKIDEMFPGLKDDDWDDFGGFTNFFAIYDAPDALKPYYKAAWLTDAFKFGHGQILSKFHLMNDGVAIYGEPYCYQYGLVNYIDWAQCAKDGWANPMIGQAPLDFFPLGQRSEYETYDWMCCQFPTAAFVNLGLRQGVTNSDNRYVAALFDDLASRADWAVMAPDDCNHAPVVSVDKLDISAKAGQTVTLKGSATDPDGDRLTATWWVPSNAWTYAAVTPAEGEEAVKTPELKVSDEHAMTTQFSVPADAVKGDRFIVNLEVQDNAERPMTRFAQVIITVNG